jgi:hypothetical protein
MQRLRRFLHLPIDSDRLSDRGPIAALGIRDRWIPEALEEFDEIEFALPLTEERDAIITMALEQGKVERILLGWAPAGDDDADTAAFDEEGLAETLRQHGDTLASLLGHLTGE